MSESEPDIQQQPAPAPYAPASQPVQPAQGAQEEAAKYGPAGRLIGVLLSPGETFADINRKPTWLVPIIIGIVVGLGTSLFFTWRVKPDYDRIVRNQIRQQTERSGTQLSAEELEQRVTIGKTIAKFFPFALIVFVPIVYLVVSGVFALGLLLVQAQTTFKKVLSVYTWTAASVSLVSLLVTVAVLMTRDTESMRTMDPKDYGNLTATNLGALVTSGSSALKSIAGSIDVFSIWTIVLLCIGFAAIAGSRKITKSRTATIVITVWVVYVLIKTGLSGIFG
jgi:hypothetical protein